MNRASPEMLRCLITPGNLDGNDTDISVLERQQAHIKWQQEQHQLQQQLAEQQQQQQLQYFDGSDQFGSVFATIPAQGAQFQGLISGEDTGLHEVVTRAVKADPGLDNGWFAGEGSGMVSGGFGIGSGSGFEMNYGISRTTSCPPAATAVVAMAETKQRESASPEKMSSTVGRESFKKRKADKNQNLKAIAEEDYSKEKRIKACAEEEDSKITEHNSNNDSKNSNNNKRETSSADTSKVSEVQKPDYIHVRARRGQATDSHSLAERVRREKISERMKYLQDLVPGCNKITGKAGMLDEIINYVQSLQRQVEFLSMKLAAVNPTLDFNTDNVFSKEVFPACTSNFPVGLTSDITNPAYLQFNPMQQVVTCDGLEMGLNVPEVALRRTTSAPTSIPETFLHSSCFNHIQPSSAWDADLQSLYGVELLQGRSTSFPTQQFTGSNEAS